MSDRLLIDSNVVIWTISASHKVSSRARRTLARPGAGLTVSTASIWEIILKHQAGKLEFEIGLGEVLDEILYASPWTILPVLPEHLQELAGLPMLHKDPFDRLLVAQAKYEGLTIVSPDERIAQYDVRTVW